MDQNYVFVLINWLLGQGAAGQAVITALHSLVAADTMSARLDALIAVLTAIKPIATTLPLPGSTTEQVDHAKLQAHPALGANGAIISALIAALPTIMQYLPAIIALFGKTPAPKPAA